jgi:hypothetical protein
MTIIRISKKQVEEASEARTVALKNNPEYQALEEELNAQIKAAAKQKDQEGES